MCGIVGIVGKSHAEQIIINGLQRLEYRGYDSAGLFVSDEKQEHLVKSQGRIKNLQEKLTNEVNGTIGIGHTRWATHGKPSEENAHPHTSQNGQLVLVHNGVIENFAELANDYLAEENFYGQTDTEIVVNLIASFMNEGLSTKAAFQKALSVIHGSYAFALVNKEEPETIYVAKNKSPLLIGLGEGFNVIASDALAVLDQTHEFVEIADNELVTVTADGIVIEDQKAKSFNAMLIKPN